LSRNFADKETNKETNKERNRPKTFVERHSAVASEALAEQVS